MNHNHVFPQTVCVVETWLDDEISDSEITINNCNVTRLNRNIHSETIFKQPFDLEFMLLSICILKFSYKIHVSLFYHHDPLSSPPTTLKNFPGGADPCIIIHLKCTIGGAPPPPNKTCKWLFRPLLDKILNAALLTP